MDEEGQRQVNYEEGEQWVREYIDDCDDEDIELHFMEVSAKNGTNIYLLFDHISNRLIEKNKD